MPGIAGVPRWATSSTSLGPVSASPPLGRWSTPPATACPPVPWPTCWRAPAACGRWSSTSTPTGPASATTSRSVAPRGSCWPTCSGPPTGTRPPRPATSSPSTPAEASFRGAAKLRGAGSRLRGRCRRRCLHRLVGRRSSGLVPPGATALGAFRHEGYYADHHHQPVADQPIADDVLAASVIGYRLISYWLVVVVGVVALVAERTQSGRARRHKAAAAQAGKPVKTPPPAAASKA